MRTGKVIDTIRIDDIKYVGALQYHGEPFVALYADMDYRRLYLMVRVNAESDEPDYVAYEVEVSDVEDYMSNQCSLSEILKDKEYWHVFVRNNRLILSSSKILDLKESIDDVDEFDSEFCYEDYWIKTFLKRLKYGRPLEVDSNERFYVPVRIIEVEQNNRKNYEY